MTPVSISLRHYSIDLVCQLANGFVNETEREHERTGEFDAAQEQESGVERFGDIEDVTCLGRKEKVSI